MKKNVINVEINPYIAPSSTGETQMVGKLKGEKLQKLSLFSFFAFQFKIFEFLEGEDKTGAGEGRRVWVIFKED